MTVLTCEETRVLLEAFHDEQLPVGDQIAVGYHLEWCAECAATFDELRLVRDALRVVVNGPILEIDEVAGLQRAVVGRLKAERTVSVPARVRAMFEDMHLVYVGAGAAVAALVCVVIMLTMFRFATIARPDSLAAIVNLLGSPGSDLNPVPIDARVLLPRALDEAFPLNLRGDAVFTLAAVVTREGRVANLELLHAFGGQQEAADLGEEIESMMDKMSRARFEPARFGGSPVAVNMVWVMAHTTVRGDPRHLSQPIARAGKKRIANTGPAAADRANA